MNELHRFFLRCRGNQVSADHYQTAWELWEACTEEERKRYRQWLATAPIFNQIRS